MRVDQGPQPVDIRERLGHAVISALNYYPIKSCGGMSLELAKICPRGFEHDRELMVVSAIEAFHRPSNSFVTQREFPRMALVTPHITDETVMVEAPTMGRLEAPLITEGERVDVSVWKSTGVQSVDQGDDLAGWFSDYLHHPVRVVRMAQDYHRQVSRERALADNDEVSYADGYPFLVISTESLDDLNARIQQRNPAYAPLPMNRFRPNIVTSGSGVPYGEDQTQRFRLGDVTFQAVKPCARCVITTTDQATAIRGKEPLTTLATYRKAEDGGVMFGQNLIHENTGIIRVGDQLQVMNIVPPQIFRS